MVLSTLVGWFIFRSNSNSGKGGCLMPMNSAGTCTHRCHCITLDAVVTCPTCELTAWTVQEPAPTGLLPDMVSTFLFPYSYTTALPHLRSSLFSHLRIHSCVPAPSYKPSFLPVFLFIMFCTMATFFPSTTQLL